MNMNQVVIYARISTNRGEQNIQQQIDYCKKYAERHEFEVLKVFKDEKTGTSKKGRRGYERLLEYLPKNPGVSLLVQDTDRLTRDFYDGVELEKFLVKYEVKIISLSDRVDLETPNGKLMFRIKLALNAQYVENLREKILIGIARAKLEGKYKGRPKGYKNKSGLKRKRGKAPQR